MFWEEEQDKQTPLEAAALDLAFSMKCAMLPVDHIHALSMALGELLPDLLDNHIGIHEIHLAGSQNGWERPDPALGQRLIPSRRSRMLLRVPCKLADDIKQKLEGAALEIDGCELVLGSAREKPLLSHPTLYARHMLMEEEEVADENRFLERMAAELTLRSIVAKKALCGKATEIYTPDGPLFTRSLMLADLSPADSIRLQQEGLGQMQHMGCGIFLPMKGIQNLG